MQSYQVLLAAFCLATLPFYLILSVPVVYSFFKEKTTKTTYFLAAGYALTAVPYLISAAIASFILPFVVLAQ